MEDSISTPSHRERTSDVMAKSDCSSAYLMQEDSKGKSNFPANCFASSKRKSSKYVEQRLSHTVCMGEHILIYIVTVPWTKPVPKSWNG